MGWGNPPISWRELEARLRGQVPDPPVPRGGNGSPRDRRPPTPAGRVPYAELHCHSAFSFLDGTDAPRRLVAEAARLGIDTLALTDHDGMYGVVRFAEAARNTGVRTVFGAELSLTAATSRTGVADPSGEHLVVLARGPEGYARLCRTITDAQLAGTKGAPVYPPLEQLGTAAAGNWQVLTGCRKGLVVRALVEHGPAAARRQLQRLVATFGRAAVAVELWDHGDPMDGHRNDALAELAVREGVEVVVSNNVHYARPASARMAAVVAAIRARRSLDELDGWLPVHAAACLRSGDEQARRFRRFPGAVEATARLGAELAFDLRLVAPKLPGFAVPDGHTPMSWLRQLVADAAPERYGPREAETVAGAWRQLDHELAVIEQLHYPGYFLIVHDIVRFCVDNDILCQGRGSAANSAVCYVLGITKADAVRLGLLFERFLSPARDGPPDIDLDIESGRREEVIQYVYDRYGRANAAQVANVITYRRRSAVRDVGRAFGHDARQLDDWAKKLSAWRGTTGPRQATRSDGNPDDAAGEEGIGLPDEGIGLPDDVATYAEQLVDTPRHLGIHSGGMVLCDRPVIEVCPVERARMPGRTVLQWDKDDCATAGLVKFDLLGLGMLSALHDTIDLIAAHHGTTVDLAALPQEDAVYDMLCRADAIGVFQVESRAQLSTLPRLRPRTFADLVVEVAIIRPGPIQGGSVHPYIRRRNGQEPVRYLHPSLQPALERTLGVPLFQEQLMQIAVDAAGFTAAEADHLRQAMGAKRSTERMERLRVRLFDGMRSRGIDDDTAAAIYAQIAAFADYGFPESHAVSFAYLVYASAWCKLHYPAAFLTGLLNNQPMGFYSPQSLVADARRHGVVVRRAHVDRGGADAVLEPDATSTGGMAVRLGLAAVRDVGDALAARIAAGAPYRSVSDLVRRAAVPRKALESLASAGALGPVDADDPTDRAARRGALWSAGALADETADRLTGTAVGVHPPPLAPMTAMELTTADLRTTGVSPTSFPLEHHRDELKARGVVTAAGLAVIEHRRRVRVAGMVTHRQRPSTAGGTVFLNLEDETGTVNVICPPTVWNAHRDVGATARALVVIGRLERAEGALSVVAQRMEPLTVAAPAVSRDFR